MPSHNHKDQDHKILEIMREAVKADTELREKYEIGEKFRFVRDRLRALLEQAESHVKTDVAIEQRTIKEVQSDETVVYVYLFNAKGSILANWKNMLASRLLYEYSINRPIYKEKPHVDAFVRSKAEKMLHAYLTVVVKTTDILVFEGLKDSLENPLIKVKEGSLRFINVIDFTHNTHVYWVDEEGVLTKKD